MVDWSVWVSSLSTLVTAVATGVLTFYTFRLWKETSQSYHTSQSADIVITFEKHPWAESGINLVIENVGQGIAKDIKIEILNPNSLSDFLDPSKIEHKYFNKAGFFHENIPLMKSGQKITHFVFTFFSTEGLDKIDFQMKATWKNYRNIEENHVSNLNLKWMMNLSYLSRKREDKILEEMSKTHKEMYNSIKKIAEELCSR